MEKLVTFLMGLAVPLFSCTILFGGKH